MLDPVLAERPCLLAVASRMEAEAVLRGLGAGVGEGLTPWRAVRVDSRFEIVLTGVGKSNAAGAVASTLHEGYAGVLSLGLAGAFPGCGVGVRGVVVGSASVLADEGAATPGGFRSQSSLGFPAVEGPGERFEADAAWRAALGVLGSEGVCATVSTCSGTDALSREIAGRTGAACEDMESAAVGLVAHRLGRAFANVRVISNRTGDRERQGWDLPGAFGVLEALAGAL
ncbi:MAG: futalosine hydrolase [Phycisphaerales bacterium]|nr:futalosine hydrolase [Phycisphaerales bacterium]